MPTNCSCNMLKRDPSRFPPCFLFSCAPPPTEAGVEALTSSTLLYVFENKPSPGVVCEIVSRGYCIAVVLYIFGCDKFMKGQLRSCSM